MWRGRFVSSRGACGARPAGQTLIELLVALGSASLLLAGLAATLVVASRMIEAPAPVQAALDAAEAARRLTDDLRYAIYFTERTATATTFAVPDRDGDGRQELIRYFWSGTPGDPLQRTVNGGPPVAVAADVRSFQLAYTVRTAQESIPRRVESSEQKLAQYAGLLMPADYQISTTRWLGQYVHPDGFVTKLPGNAVAWHPTRVTLWVETDGPRDGQSLVQLRRAGSDATPTSTVLEQIPYLESSAPSLYIPVAFRFQGVWLAPNEGVWIVVQGLTNHALSVLFDNWGGTGRVFTTDAGATWTPHGNGDSLLYELYGTYVTEGTPHVVRRRFITGVSVNLRLGGDAAGRIDTSVALANAPELLAGLWHLDFDRDPTAVDANFDGSGDWVRRDGKAFSPSSLGGGIWRADAPLDSRPKYDFSALTTAEVRFRNTGVGGQGAVFALNADWSGSTCIPLRASVALAADGTQTLTVSRQTDSTTFVPWLTVPGLASGFVEVRLVIDPSAKVVGVWVQGVFQGLYSYTPVAPGNDDRFASVYADGSAAEFDYVCLRISEPGG